MTSIVPSKFISYLLSPNKNMYLQPQSIFAENEKLEVNLAVDWENGIHSDMVEPELSTDLAPSFIDDIPTIEAANLIDAKILNASVSSDKLHIQNFNVTDLLQLWFEDRLFNELLQQFRWDFQWVNEVNFLKFTCRDLTFEFLEIFV